MQALSARKAAEAAAANAIEQRSLTAATAKRLESELLDTKEDLEAWLHPELIA